MKFQIGQKVVFLRESGGGVVLSVEPKGCYKVEDQDGFSRICHFSELAPVHGEDYKVSEETIDLVREEKTVNPLKQKQAVAKEPDRWEIDLHIEELVDSHAGWSNAEILNRQLYEFRSFLNKARKARIRRLIIIHGVGEGVLRHEIRSFLNDMQGVEYYDADYREYGQGATAVEIHYF